jgi:Lsr2
MAQSVTVMLVDDIDQSQAAETVHFGLDGTAYEIDLSARHASDLRSMAGRYIGAARRAGQAPARVRQQRRSRPRTQMDREQSRRIRSWAMERGLLASPRGRIPQHVADEYQAAMRVSPAPVRSPGAAGPQPASRGSRTKPASRRRAPRGAAAGDTRAV